MADRVGFRIAGRRGEIWSRSGRAAPCITAMHGPLGSRRGWRACLIALATGAALFTGGAGAEATIMLDQGFGFADRPGDFEARFFWDLPAAGDDKAGPFTGNCGGGSKCWTVKSLESLAPGKDDPKRSLIVFPQHNPGQIPIDVGHGPNAITGTLGFFDILRPPAGKSIYVSANRIAHGQHSDYFTGVMKVPRADALSITIKGKHEGAFNPMQASFTNFSDKPLTGYYQPSYGTPRPGEIPDVGDQIPFGTVKPKEAAKRENLPKNSNGANPTDYLVVASGSATTQTELGYLGTVGDDPTITELELTPLTEMLAPDGFVVPMLRDVSVDVDLYVFVDLLLWLGADATFTPLEEYAVVGGTSDLLPGFFVSTTPVSINPDGSFVGTPYSGLAFAAAGIDGHVVPSPPTLAMLAAAIMGLAGRALGHATAAHRGRHR